MPVFSAGSRRNSTARFEEKIGSLITRTFTCTINEAFNELKITEEIARIQAGHHTFWSRSSSNNAAFGALERLRTKYTSILVNMIKRWNKSIGFSEKLQQCIESEEDTKKRILRFSEILSIIEETHALYTRAFDMNEDGLIAVSDKIRQEREVYTSNFNYHKLYARSGKGVFFAMHPFDHISGSAGPYELATAFQTDQPFVWIETIAYINIF